MKVIAKNDVQQMRGFVNMLRTQKRDFQIVQTSYTTTVRYKDIDYLFTNKVGSTMTFSAFNRIKSDIIKSGIVIDKIPRLDIRYFGVNEFLKSKKELPDDVYCIDINSAYLTTLLNTGLITEETFLRVCKYGKEVRLKSVGMLATSKNVMTYTSGKLSDHTIQTDPYLRNYFFFCCYQVGEVMNNIADKLAEDFLFYWVDGIYVRGKEQAETVRKLLTLSGYQSKVKKLTDCQFYTENGNFLFSYRDDLHDKVKRYNVPFDDEENRRRMKSFLLTLKTETRQLLEQ